MLPEGTTAFGEVLTSEASKAALQKGKLSARLTHIDVSGQRIEISGDLSAVGKGGKSDDAVKLILVPFYAPFAPGNNAKFKAGEIVSGVVARDHMVDAIEANGTISQLRFMPADGTSAPPPVS